MSRQDSTHGSFPGLRATASARGGRSAEHRRARRRLERRKAKRRRRQAAALALITAIALAASVLSGAWSSSGRAGLASKTTRPAATPIRVARASPTGPRRQAATRQAARAGPTGPRRQVATRQVARSAPSPGSLPQTHAFPSADSPRFKSLMGSLWAGIVHDSVEQALPAFFPKQAFLQLKAIAGAGADWTDRLVHDYSLDIAAAHALLGRDPQRARLVRVEVDSSYGHWIEPGVCYNGIGYYEMPNARVLYSENGALRSFGIASMISWRGVWYVVHLGAVLRSSDVGAVDEPAPGSGVSVYSGTC